jgi:hypothetical protein
VNTAPLGTPIYDEAGPWLCDCCERAVWYVRGSMWHGEARICRACFFLWYDYGLTDTEALKAEVLAREASGRWPFPSAEIGIARADSKPAGTG